MKRAILSMTKGRSALGAWIEDRTMPVLDALAQLYVFPHAQERYHWRKEVWANLYRVKKLKSNSKYPSAEFIYVNSWGIDGGDINLSIQYVIDKEDELTPRDDISLSEFSALAENYFRWLSNQLSRNGQVSKTQVFEKLDELGL